MTPCLPDTKAKMENPSNPSRASRSGVRRLRPRLRPRAFDPGSSSPGESDESPSSPSTLLASCLAGLGGMTAGGGARRDRRRSVRSIQTIASALLAMCALIVLSGGFAHLPTMISSVSRRLLVDDSSTSELIPVSGVRTATFFVPVEPHLKHNNKMNAHFSLEHYARGLANTCQFLIQLDHPAYLLGDQAFIQSRAATCADLAADEGGRYEMDGLKHGEAASMVQRHMCHRKFAADKHDARRILKETVLLYLNKIDVLCDLAQQAPTDLTVLVDSDLDPDLWSTVLSLIDRRKKDARDATLTVYEHPDYGYRSWFGRPSCRTHPTANTEFMAIRGKDCPAVQAAYDEILEGLVETAAGVNLLPDAGPCPCFDDEIVLHYLKKDHPELVSFFGAPRSIDGDDDDSLFDEDVADEVDFGAVARMLKNGDDGDGKAEGAADDGDEEEEEEEGDDAGERAEEDAVEEKEE